MKSYPNRKADFRAEVATFLNSKQSPDDILAFVYASSMVLRQGLALTEQDILDAIKTEYIKKNET